MSIFPQLFYNEGVCVITIHNLKNSFFTKSYLAAFIYSHRLNNLWHQLLTLKYRKRLRRP